MINSTKVDPLNHPQLEFMLVDSNSLQILRSNLAVRDNLGLAHDALHQLKLGDIHSELSQPELVAKIAALPASTDAPPLPDRPVFVANTGELTAVNTRYKSSSARPGCTIPP